MKETIITSSVLILCVMLIRHFLKGKISSRLQYALWLLVAVRLIMPMPAQISLSLGMVDELRVMNLTKRLETRFGDLTERLEQPVSFAVNMDSLLGQQAAEYVLGEDADILETNIADGPTSVFLAGRLGFTWLDVMRFLWFGGIGAAAIWILAVNLRFRHKLHKERCAFAVPAEVEAGFQTMQKHKKHIGRVKVYTLRHLVSPCLYGFPGREAVYLPESITEEENRLRHVLTHEICHKRHGDSFWSLLRSGLLIFYWFHPLVWAAAVLSKRDCELACDESALRMLGEEERIDYGRTLLSIISEKGKWSDFACTATTMTGTAKSIKERIYYIAKKPKVLGVAAAAALVLLTAVSVLVFTRSPQFSGGTWESGAICVMTGDKKIMLPDTIAGISGYADVEGSVNDLIVYQVSSDREVGRFCTVTYEKALELVDSGRTVIPLGGYGQNNMLKRYMGIPYSETIHTYGSSENAAEQSEKEPFSFDGKSEWKDDGSNRSAKKPFAFDGQSEWDDEEQAEEITGGAVNGVPGTDSNEDDTTYMIPDETTEAESMAGEVTVEYLPEEQISQMQGTDVGTEDDSIVYLPDETITQVETSYDPYMRDCYLYLSADHTGVKEKDLEEMQYIDSELRTAAGQVIVTGINREISGETFEKLAEHRTLYLGDNGKVGALMEALPLPRRLSREGMELGTETEEMILQINYSLDQEEWEQWEYIDHDVMRFDAVMLFATIENLEQCVFHVESDTGLLLEDTVYGREELTEQMGVESLWRDLEGEELQSWLRELHERVVSSFLG